MKKPTITVQHKSDATVEIQGTLPWETFRTYEAQAFERLSKHLEIDGFRKGNVPEAIAKKHLGDELILADMAELAIGALYPTILEDEHIDAIGHPRLTITKLARDNELGFTLTTAILPKITLPAYKKIAKTIPKETAPTVTDEEVAKVIEDLRQIRAYGHVHDHTDEDHGHTEPLPEVDDAFAKSFGNFATVDELKTKIRENILKEKDAAQNDKRRIAIMDAIIKETSFSVPEIIIDSEKEKMLSQMEQEVTRTGMTFSDYLTHIKKDRETLKTEFAPEAERRARFQMVINAIAKDAGIAPTEEELEKETEQLLAMYPGADKARTKAYADMVLTNNKVLTMLENE